MSKKRTHEEYVKQVYSINPQIEVVGEYKNVYTKILHKCKIDQHEWMAIPSNILRGEGCPICGRCSTAKSRRKTHEQYVNEVRNINPNIKVLEQYINNRTPILHQCLIDKYKWSVPPRYIIQGIGCPVCSGRVALNGVSDLYTTQPELASEWNYKLNGNIKPSDVKQGSHLNAWWTCPDCGNNYQAQIYNRVYGHTGCPECSKINQTSIPELKTYYYIKKYFPDAISGYKDHKHNLTELDIYIPSLCVGIEYDGQEWHQNINNDIQKDNICKSLNIKLIRIRENKCPKYDGDCIFVFLNRNSQHALAKSIMNILKMLDVKDPQVDFKKDHNEIHKLINYKRKERSLASIRPDLVCDWNYDKNGNMRPEKVAAYSNCHAWWLCSKCGHEWFATINSRSSGSGCPNCYTKHFTEKNENTL